jgi:hypothetical protein
MSRLLALGLVLSLAACTSPADVAGEYTLSLTNRANGCNLQNWTVDGTTQNVHASVTQNNDTAAATVTGIAGTYLDVVLGDHVFTGGVDGDNLQLTLFGTRSGTSGNCTFTYNAVLHGTLSNDVLTGVIDYEAKTNGNPDCAALTGCVSLQEFNGTRPPS